MGILIDGVMFEKVANGVESYECEDCGFSTLDEYVEECEDCGGDLGVKREFSGTDCDECGEFLDLEDFVYLSADSTYLCEVCVEK